MKKILVLMVGLLLIGANVFAQGDLVVNGKLGVGTVTPAYKLDVNSTDATVVNVKATKTNTSFLNASMFTMDIDSTNAGGNALLVAPIHTSTTTTTGDMRGALYNTFLNGAGTLTSFTGMQNQTALRTSAGNYAISTVTGSQLLFTKGSPNTGTHTITNYNGIHSLGVNAGGGAINGTNWRHAYFMDWPSYDGTVANVAGLWIDKQTLGGKNYGIVLNGNGSFIAPGDESDYGAAIVFGSNQCCKIFSDGTTIKAADANGNLTIISPHDPETGEWIFYSQNVKTGRTVRVNMEKLVKAVEKLTGETFMVETILEGK